jgi:myb proto-oncogene protein
MKTFLFVYFLQDERLRQAVETYKAKNWKKIAEQFDDKTDVQCLHRWQKVLNPDLIKGPWSKEVCAFILST